MKTVLIANEKTLEKYEGQYFDEIIEVQVSPTTNTIDADAKVVTKVVNDLWGKYKEEIVVTLNAASPYNVMLINLSILLGQSGVKITLPHYNGKRTTVDAEAKAYIEKKEKGIK